MYIIISKNNNIIDICDDLQLIEDKWVKIKSDTLIQIDMIKIVELNEISIDILENPCDYYYINNQFIKNYELYSLKLQKIEEMRSLCGYKIINEFYSTCKGESKKYDCETYDQLNISGMTNVAQLILLNFTNQSLMYKNSEQMICETYTPQEIILLASDLKNHVESKLHRFDKLRLYILDNDRTEEELKNLIWDTENVI